MATKKKKSENTPISYTSGGVTASFNAGVYENYLKGNPKQTGWVTVQKQKTPSNTPMTYSNGPTTATFDPSLYNKYLKSQTASQLSIGNYMRAAQKRYDELVGYRDSYARNTESYKSSANLNEQRNDVLGRMDREIEALQKELEPWREYQRAQQEAAYNRRDVDLSGVDWDTISSDDIAAMDFKNADLESVNLESLKGRMEKAKNEGGFFGKAKRTVGNALTLVDSLTNSVPGLKYSPVGLINKGYGALGNKLANDEATAGLASLEELYNRAEEVQRYKGYEKTVADFEKRLNDTKSWDALEAYKNPQQTDVDKNGNYVPMNTDPAPSADWAWDPDAEEKDPSSFDIDPDTTYSARWENGRQAAMRGFQGTGITEDMILAYLDAKTRLENRENALRETKEARQRAEQGGWAAVGETAKNVPRRLLGGPAGALSATFEKMNGDPVDWYGQFQVPGMKARATTEQIAGDIAEDSQILSYAYQMGNSALDMAAVAISTKLGLAPIVGASMMGGSAAQQAMFDAHERGLDDAHAVGTGIAAGIFETVFEKYSLERWLKTKPITATTFRGRFLQTMGNIGRQGFVEGSEEVFTSMANAAYDRLMNGGLSEYETSVRKYMADGMSASEARKKAENDFISGLAMDFSGGFLLGGLMGGAGTAVNTIAANRDARATYGGENLQNTIDSALAVDPNNAFAKRAQQRAAAGKKVSGSNIRYMVESMKRTEQGLDTDRVKGAVSQELQKRGVSAEDAQAQAKVIAKKWAGDIVNQVRDAANMAHDERFELTGEEQQTLKDSKYADDILSDLRSTGDAENWVDDVENRELKTGRQQLRETNKMLKTISRAYLDSQAADVLTENDTTALEERFGKAGAEAFAAMKPKGANDGVYYHAFNTAFLYGENGVSVEAAKDAVDGRISDIAVKAAYSAGKGRADYALQKNVKVQMARLTGVRNKTPGRVNITADTNGLTATQWASINAIRAFSTVTGINVNVVEGGVDANGKFITQNGTFNAKTNTITIDINAGRGNINDALAPVMMKTMGHEVTHFIQNNNAEGYEDLKRFVAKTLVEKGLNLEDLAREKMDLDEADRQSNPARKDEKPMTFEEAMDEVVADACEDMLRDTKAIDALAKENWSLFKQIRNWIRNWVRSIKRAFEAGGYSHKEAQAMLDKAAELQKIWDDAFVRAVQNYQQTADGRVAVEMTGKNGETVAVNDGNGHVQASMRTYREGGREQLRTYLEQRVKDNAITRQEADDMISQMDEMYDLCKTFADQYALFGQWSEAEVRVDPKTGNPIFSVVKANGEYAMNLDFSLVCKKRRTLDAVFEQMINDGIMEDFEMKEASIAAINDIIRDHGFETACALCFVDSKRYRQGIVADAFVGMYNELVRSMIKDGQHADAFNFGGNSLIVNDGKGIDTLKDSDLDFTRINEVLKTEGKKTVLYKIANDLKENPADRKLLMRGDFMSAKAFDTVKETNQRIMGLYNAKKGAGGPKASSLDVQYLNEIIGQKKFNAEKAYSVGGVRIQSFSDYLPRLVFDYMQMIADLHAKNLPAHAYTKEPLFILQFGLTGIKGNMSLVPEVIDGGVAPGLDKDGNYTWRDGQSFGSTVYGGSKAFIQKCYEIIGKKYSGQDRLTAAEGYELAKAIQNAPGYGVNCGTIAVGVSDEHIRKMLRDPDIRMVIPYHKSSLNHIVAVMTNIDKYNDYTDQQNTRRWGKDETGKEKWKKLAKNQKDFNYNEALQRLGDAKAAADEYLAWCDKKGYLPKFDQFRDEEGYYKLLEDFSTYDMNGEAAPQGGVTLTLPGEDSAFGSMAELMRMGLEEDALLQGKQDSAVPEIVAEIKKTLPGIEAKQRVQMSERTFSDPSTGERVQYSTREKPAPEPLRNEDGSIKYVYKAFYAMNGKLYPPMVANLSDEEKRRVKGAVSGTQRSLDTPVGIWLDADIGELALDENGAPLRNTRGRLAVVNAKGGGTLAFRPGWHLGEWPDAKQFNKNSAEYGARSVMPASMVFAKCEIAADRDYQLDAMEMGMKENGKFDRTQAGLPYVPEDGYYKYRTNVDPTTAPWYITGAMRVVEILDDDDCAAICREYGVQPSPREGGKINLADYGLKRGPVTPTANPEEYRKSDSAKQNEARLQEALADEQYADAYAPHRINFEDAEIQKEFARNRQDAEYYRQQYEARGEQKVQYSVRLMNDESNAEMVTRLSAASVQYVMASKQSLAAAAAMNVSHSTAQNVRDVLYPVLERLGIFGTHYNEVMDVTFDYSRAAGDRSLSHQIKITGMDYSAQALVLANLKELCRTAYPVEAHVDEKPTSKTASIKQVVTLYNALQAGDDAIFAKMTVKFPKERANRLHMVISTDIKKGLDLALIADGTLRQSADKSNPTISIPKVLEIVKDNAEFTKRIPVGDILGRNVQKSLRSPTDISSRELLANALESVAQNAAERDILKNYQAKVEKLSDIQQKLNEQRALMRDHINGTHKLTTDEMMKARNRAKIYADQLDRADKALLKLEGMGPVKAMLDREHKAFRKAVEANERSQAQLARYNERMQKRIEDARQSMENYRQRRHETEDRRKYKGRINRIANDFRQMILHPTDTRYAPTDLMAGCYQVALMLDTSGEREDTKSKAKFREQMQRIENQYNALKDSHDSDYAMEYDQDFAYMVGQLRQRLDGKAIRDLSVAELEDVSNVLNDIYQMLRQAKYQIGKDEQVTNYSMGERIVRQQTEYNARQRNAGTRALAGVNRVAGNVMRNVRRMTDYDGDAAISQLMDDINRGIRKKNRFAMEAEKLFDKFSGKRLRESNTKLNTYTLGGEEVQMTEQQAMQVILTWEREAVNGITRHMTGGGILLPNQAEMKKGRGTEAIRTGQNVYGITQEEVQGVYDTLDEWARDYMGTARDFFNGMAKDAINEATMQTKHRRMATTEAYIPFEIDSNTVAQEIEGVKFDATIEGMGMLKSVQEGAGNALIMRGLNTIVQRHIDKVGQVYGLAAPIKNFNKAMGVKMMGSSRVASAALNSADLKVLEDAVRDLQTPRQRARNVITNAMDKLQSAFVKATLLSNISVTIKQAASYSTAGLYLSQKALAPYQTTVAALFAANNSKMAKNLFAEIDEHTAAHYIRRKGMSLQEAATVAQDNGPVTRWMDEHIKADALNPLKWIQNMDVATTAALWLATKKQVELDGMTEADAGYWDKVTELYEKVIEDTQPNYDVLHRPEMQRTTDSLVKSILMFKTQPLQNAGIIWDAVGNYAAARRTGKGVAEARKTLTRAVGSQVASLAVFAAMSFLAYAAKNRLGRYKDDEEELTVESVMKVILKDMVSNSANLVMPVFGDAAFNAVDNVAKKARGETTYDVLSVPAVDMVNDWLKDVNSLVGHLSDLDSGKDKIPTDLRVVSMDVAALFGIPAENVYNIIRGTVGNVTDSIGMPLDWATDEEHTTKGMKAAWNNGHFDAAKEKLDALIAEKVANGKTEKEAKSALRSVMTTEFKPQYIAAYRKGDKAEMERIRKILSMCKLYDDLSKTIGDWIKKSED